MIHFIMREATMSRPSITETESNPRMKHAEHHLQWTTVKNTLDQPISERHRTKAITMSKTESLSGNLNQIRLSDSFHAKFLKIAIGPDIMVSCHKIDVHTTINKFLDCSKHSNITLGYHIPVFIPEIPDITKHIHSRSVLRKRSKEVRKAALTGNGICHLEA